MIKRFNIIFLYVFLLCAENVFGQAFQYHLHTAQISSADNSAIYEGAISLYANPAAPPDGTKTWDFSLSAHNRYNTDIRGLTGALLMSMNNNNSSVGLVIGNYGIDGFSRSLVSVNYSRRIGASSYLGIQGHWHQLQIEALGSSSIADMTIGSWHQLSDRWVISVYVLNPIEATRNTSRLYGKIDVGTALIISENLELFSSISRAWDNEWSFRPGLKYIPLDVISIYAAMNTSPSSLSFGIALNIPNGLKMNLGTNTHPHLGRHLSLGVGYGIP